MGKRLTNKTLYWILSILCVIVVSLAIIIICLILKKPQSESVETSSASSADTVNASITESTFSSGNIDEANSSMTENTFSNDSKVSQATQNSATVASNTEKCNHNYHNKVKSPTCKKDGYTVHTCTICGYSYTDSVVAAKHNYVNYKCSYCGEIDKSNTFEYLKQWILEKGTTDGNYCTLIWNNDEKTYKITYDKKCDCINIISNTQVQSNSYKYLYLAVISLPKISNSYSYVFGTTNLTLNSTTYKYSGTIESNTFSENTPISYDDFYSDIYNSSSNDQLELARTEIIMSLIVAGGILHGDFGEYGDSGIGLDDLGFTEFAKNFED